MRYFVFLASSKLKSTRSQGYDTDLRLDGGFPDKLALKLAEVTDLYFRCRIGIGCNVVTGTPHDRLEHSPSLEQAFYTVTPLLRCANDGSVLSYK